MGKLVLGVVVLAMGIAAWNMVPEMVDMARGKADMDRVDEIKKSNLRH